MRIDHVTLLVTVEDRWLVDVGFGDSFVEPLRLDSRAEQPQGKRFIPPRPSPGLPLHAGPGLLAGERVTDASRSAARV